MYKKKLPVGIRIVFAFLSVLLCIALFATTLVTIAVTDLKVVTSRDGLQTIITEAFFPKSASVRVIPKLTGGNAVGGFGALGSLGGEEMDQNMLVDALYDMLAEQAGGELPVSKEEVSELLEESSIPEFISDKAAGIISDVIMGESTTTITKEEVIELIEENADLIEEKLDITIEQEHIDAIGGWIEESEVLENVQQEIQEVIGITPPAVTPDSPTGSTGSTGESGSEVPQKKPAGSILDLVGPEAAAPTNIAEVFALLRAVSSTESLLICVGACLLLLVFLLLTHWGRPFAAIRSAGISVMIAGLIMTLPGLVASFLPAGDPILIIAQKIFSMTITVSLCFAGLGLVMIVAGSILNGVFKHKAKAAMLVAAAPVAVVEVPAVEFIPAEETAPVEAAPVEEAAAVEEIPVMETPVEEAPVAEAAEESTKAEAVAAAEE